MNRFIKKLLCISVCLFVVSGFSSCMKQTDTDGETPEIESVDTVEFMASEQGIGVVSVCRIEKTAENSTLYEDEDIAGIIICNDTDRTLQYAEITATFSDGTVHNYKVSTVPPGEYCQVAEDNSAQFRSISTGFFGFEISKVAFFAQEPSVYSDTLQFSGTDGVLNVKNISETDITDDIVVYYKDYKNSQLLSGITYRITFSGGLAAGEIKQAPASHYRQNESIIMFAQFVSSEVA